MANETRTSIQSRDVQIIQGIEKHLQSTPSMIFGGVTYTPTTLAALFQSQINALNTSVSARAQWIAASQAASALAKTATNAKTGLLELVRQTFNSAPDILADFGFQPKKKTGTKDPVTKVVAAAKSRATRQARHTMGNVQKLGVVGSLTGPIVVTPGASGSRDTVSSSAPVAAAEAQPSPLAPTDTSAHAAELAFAPGAPQPAPTTKPPSA